MNDNSDHDEEVATSSSDATHKQKVDQIQKAASTSTLPTTTATSSKLHNKGQAGTDICHAALKPFQKKLCFHVIEAL